MEKKEKPTVEESRKYLVISDAYSIYRTEDTLEDAKKAIAFFMDSDGIPEDEIYLFPLGDEVVFHAQTEIAITD